MARWNWADSIARAASGSTTQLAFDLSSRAVNAAGGIHGDLLIGAYRTDPKVNVRADSSYVVFGRSSDLLADGFE